MAEVQSKMVELMPGRLESASTELAVLFRGWLHPQTVRARRMAVCPSCVHSHRVNLEVPRSMYV